MRPAYLTGTSGDDVSSAYGEDVRPHDNHLISNSTIRAKIRPFPSVATYPTSWTGPLSFEQIYDDLVHYVTNFMKRWGFHRTNHLPDCIQHGFMALWLELCRVASHPPHKRKRHRPHPRQWGMLASGLAA